MVLWDYCVERRARIHNMTAKGSFSLHGSNPHTITTGEEGNISNLCLFAWYERCYFRDHNASFPANCEVLGRVLGPARGIGNEMCQWILQSNGKVIPRCTLQPLNTAELHSPSEQLKQVTFDTSIRQRLGDSLSMPKPSEEIDKSDESFDKTDESALQYNMEDTVNYNGQLLDQQPSYDKLLNAEVKMQLEDGQKSSGKIKQQTLGPNGRVSGTYHDNPYLNTLLYDVEFDDGTVKEHTANIIAEHIILQCDAQIQPDDNIDAVVDVMKDDSTAIHMDDRFVITRSGQKRPQKTTAGWRLLVRWMDGSKSWVALNKLKESNPVEVAKFAKAQGIEKEPAFAWWIPFTLKKHDIILLAVKFQSGRVMHKYGTEIPSSIQQAKALDASNGNKLWGKALRKEMYNVGVAFEVLDEGQQAPPGWTKVTGHLVWDIKMDLTGKARWVLDDPPGPPMQESSHVRASG